MPSELRQPTARVEVRVHFPSKFEATHKFESWKMGWDLGEGRAEPRTGKLQFYAPSEARAQRGRVPQAALFAAEERRCFDFFPSSAGSKGEAQSINYRLFPHHGADGDKNW